MTINFKLYGDLILGAPDFDFKANLEQLDIWDAAELESLASLTNDDIASEHYSTFGMTVFPFGHYYTSTGRNYAGDNDGEILRLYKEEAFDFETLSLGMGPTHLGTQLKFLQYTIDQGRPHLTREFLTNHVLNWIHSLNISLGETNGHIFPKLIKHIESDLTSLWQDLNGTEHLDEFHFQLQDFDYKKDLLENEKTSLKDIGEMLMTPALCGVFISKPTLTQFASQLEIPTGFGSRVMMTETIFKEAVNYEKIEKLFSMLEAYFTHWEKSYEDYPVTPVAEVWKSRIQDVRNMLSEIQTNF